MMSPERRVIAQAFEGDPDASNADPTDETARIGHELGR